MPSDDARKPPQRYHSRTRVLATLLSGAFALPMLFMFGVTVREIFRPPEPPVYNIVPPES